MALQRLKDLYQWGHKSRQEYLNECAVIQRELDSLRPPANNGESLGKLAAFLNDVGMAWAEADQRQRNRLARQLFDAVWVRNEKVVAVRPRPELRSFFALSDECHAGSMSGDPEGIRTPDLHRDRVAC